MNIIDLNSLNGGVVLGAIKARMNVLYAYNVTETFKKNLPQVRVGSQTDTATDLPRTEIISISRYDLADWDRIRNFIKHIQPRFVVGFGKKREDLCLDGYHIYGNDVVNTSRHGVPLDRDIRVQVLTRYDVIRKSMYFPLPEDGPEEVAEENIELNKLMGFPPDYEVLDKESFKQEVPATFAAMVFTELRDWV